ncbi:MAG: hypothetical protein AAF198_12115 [Pseudomonadota bacterium]
MVNHVIVHIGADKTGSTSIQTALDGYDDGRSFVPKFKYEHHHFELSLAFEDYDYFKTTKLFEAEYSDWSNEEVLVERARVRQLIMEALSCRKRRTVIFTGEGLRLMTSEARLEMLELFASYGCRTTIVAYVRDPIAYAASAFQQQVKNAGRFVIQKKIKTNYDRLIKVFQNMIPPNRLIVREFRKQVLHRHDVVHDFCKVTGITFKDSVYSNESMAWDALKLVFGLNQIAKKHSLAGDRSKRLALVEAIMHLYKEHPKPEKLDFAELVDFSTTDLLYQVSGIRFERPVDRGIRPKLDTLLTDLSTVDLAPFNQLLTSKGLTHVDHDGVFKALDLLQSKFDLMPDAKFSEDERHRSSIIGQTVVFRDPEVTNSKWRKRLEPSELTRQFRKLRIKLNFYVGA